MAEPEELETLVYCLGPIGGQTNAVITEGSAFSSKDDYTKKGYARYIKEANNVLKFHRLIIDYFIDSLTPPPYMMNPLAFIDGNFEDMKESIRNMKQYWREMFKEHQYHLRQVLKNPNPNVIPAVQEFSEESSSSSSAKIRKLDRKASSEASAKTFKSESESTSETGEKNLAIETEATPATDSVQVSIDEVFPKSIFLQSLKDFHQAVKQGFQKLKGELKKALERIPTPERTVPDIKGFTFRKMEKFAKWKYALKILDVLVQELEKKFAELDLDLEQKKENEKRLTDWLYFDDGLKDRKYHHRLLITMELTSPVEEISALVCKQLRRFEKITKSLAKELPSEFEAFNVKIEDLKCMALYGTPLRRALVPQASTDSADSLFNVDEIEKDEILNST